MNEARTQRGAVAWIFVLLGPALTMAFALIQAIVHSVIVPGDVSAFVLAVLLGTEPLGFITPWLLLMLPFGLTGVVAFRLDERLNGLGFIAACTAVGATLTLLCAPLFSAAPDLSMVIQAGFAALLCALVTRIRLPVRRGPLLPRP